MLVDVDGVLRLRNHRVRAPQDAQNVLVHDGAADQRGEMAREHAQHEERADAVDEARQLESAQQAGERPAQGLSENSNGNPVSAQPTNVSMSTECRIRSVRVNRR